MRGPNVVFVHLAGSKDEIGHRLAARSEHFMPATLLESQISTLEPPGPDENTLVVNVGGKPPTSPRRSSTGSVSRRTRVVHSVRLSPRMNRGFSGSDSARTHDLKP